MDQTHDDLESRIRGIGRGLAESFRLVLNALPGPVQRPQQIAEQLGLNRDISGRVLSATRAADPLSVAHTIPGPEPLRKLLRAAEVRHRVEREIIESADAAVDRFEQLIREDAGDRPALDAMISAMLPAARERFELGAKQTIFKGTSLLKGVLADRWLHTALVHPSASDPGFHDVAHMYGTLGLRRLRPGITVKFSYRQFGTAQQPWRTFDGQVPEHSDGAELDRFCTLPAARLDVERTPDGAVYVLAGAAVGPRSACDKLVAELRPRAMAREPGQGPRNRKSLFVAPSVPVRELVFDMLLHDDAYPAAQPTLIMYDTAVDGMASVNDRARDADRLDVTESVTVLGRGRDAFGLNDMPRYVDALDSIAGELGLSLDEFRGFRCRIQYPMHGAQACMAFDA